MAHLISQKLLAGKSYYRVGGHEIRTKAVPIYEFIEEKKFAKAERVSAASAIRYSLWIMCNTKVKSVLFATHSYGRYVQLMIPSGEAVNGKRWT